MNVSRLLRTALVPAVLFLASSAFAQTGPNTQASAAPAGHYAVEPNHTQIMFGVLHFGFTKFYGNFSGSSGTLTFDPKQPSADTLSISVPTSSVKTTSDKLTEELASADWLDAGKSSDISFKSTKVTALGGNKFQIAGDLSLHGITKPVTLTASFVGSGANPFNKKYTLGFDASGTIKRSDFGVTKLEGLVGDEVELILSGAFEKQD